ncbi:craniofacial development protein 2-like [Malaya genurostris]|uniref:craniofacial development protein 2-like n=1 Tax=Malaya genurostris TaxID=325434 RepID=UPI0026F394E1|nr:craniofacial development protein 2-like [Malaya genurostris]
MCEGASNIALVLTSSNSHASTVHQGGAEKLRTDLTATTFSMKQRTRIGTWNVLTLAQQGKPAHLANEARRMKLEILGLREVRWPNFGEHRIPSGQILLYSGLRGEHAPRHRGVGFLLSAQAHSALIKWEPISERIIVARDRTRVRNLTIIQTYAPTDAADLQDNENLYSQINAAVDRIPKGDIMICMGDFNVKIGSDNSYYERIMGRHGRRRRESRCNRGHSSPLRYLMTPKWGEDECDKVCERRDCSSTSNIFSKCQPGHHHLGMTRLGSCVSHA